MEIEYNIDTKTMKIYYTTYITKKIVNRIKNLIKYKDLNCLRGMTPIKVNEIPACHMSVVREIEGLKNG